MDSAEAQVDASVIICVRNGAATIGRQLAALDRQEDCPPFEVVVVDNGSTDRTRDVVQAWIARPYHAAQIVRLIDGPREPGLPRTRNVGAVHASGRVLAYCDADDEVDAKWLGALARAMDQDQLVGGRILARTAGGTDRHELFGDGLIATRYLPHVGGSNWATTRQAYLTVGGFDESLPSYGFDDVDFSWRMQEAGFPATYARGAIVHFTVSDASASIRKRLALGQGRVLMAARYPRYDPRHYTVRVALGDLTRESVDLLRVSIRNRGVDRTRAGRLVATAGRLIGAVKYRGGRRLPQRALLATDEYVDG